MDDGLSQVLKKSGEARLHKLEKFVLFDARCARISLVFLTGGIPVLERVEPAHQESSLGLMEVTT